MGKFFRNIILLFLSGTAFPAFSESIRNENISLDYNVEAHSTFAGGENTPFWLVSNIEGLGSPEFNNGYIRGRVYKREDSGKRLSWGAGMDIVGAWNLTSNFRIQQMYVEMHYRSLQIRIGSKNEESEYNDRRLSTGDLLFSGNAPAIPGLRIGTTGFSPFWGTKGWLAVKVYLEYGIFTDSRWIKNWVNPETQWPSGILFCSRGLWLRIGKKETYPLTLDLGIEMGTQFGGTIHSPEGVIKMPSGFLDWIKAFIPVAGNSSTPESEQTNVQGNMAGEYNVAIAWQPSSDWKVRLYYEHYFEDHSQMFLEYGRWKDGLIGLEITFPRNPFVKKMVYEYIATKDQTGAVNHDYTPEIPEQVSGRDGYYSHYLYGAWQNWGMTMGSPLAISPIYNRNHVLSIYDSRFITNHFGLEGQPFDFLEWRALLTFSRNWGTYNRPFPYQMNNFSSFLEITGRVPKLSGWYAQASIAFDHGKLLGNNFGGGLTIGYEGNIDIRK